MLSFKTSISIFLFCSALTAHHLEWITLEIKSPSEAIINPNNLNRIKRFLLQNKQVSNYTTMFNNTPYFQSDNYSFYLKPDPGGPSNSPLWNKDCDPSKGDFNTLVIRRNINKPLSDEDFKDQYRAIEFKEGENILVKVLQAQPDMKVYQIRLMAEQSIQEILNLINNLKDSKIESK